MTGAASTRLLGRIERALGSRGAPWFFGGLSLTLVTWLFGSLSPLPWVYDEAAYLLQAKIFATGRWSVPGPPVPEFFEQLHVLVTPKLVPKYPPGHALLLVPGISVGASGLVPIVLSGVTGALVFGFARSLADGWTALLTWVIWTTAPVELYIRPSYLSQVSTTLIWLLAWWCLARWRRDGGAAWLAGLAALAAVGVLTRPVTAIAFLVPIAVEVLAQVCRRRTWAELVPATAVALPILAVAPWWSWATIGQVYPTPYSEYSRIYTPWNLPGFSIDRSPPLRPEIPAVRRFRTEWLPVHEAHTVPRLPAIAASRLAGIAETFWGDGAVPDRNPLPPLRWLLFGAALLGLAGAGAEVRVVLWCGAALFVAMLSLASRPLWTVYYLELSPALAFLSARGARRIAEWIGRRATALGSMSGPALLVAGLLVAVPGSIDRLLRARQQHVDLRTVPTELARAIDSLPGKAVIFVQAGPAHRPHESYVVNEPDLEGRRVWLVHDRGGDNARLLALVPDRTPYRFDPATGTLRSGAIP